MTNPVFLSYTHGRGTGAAEALSKELGAEVTFLDSEDIDPGQNFVDTLLDGLLGAKVVVVFLDPTYFERPYCRFEYEVAVAAYQMLVERNGSEAEKRAALAHVVVALPPRGAAQLMERLPRPLQETDWLAADDTAGLAGLVRQRLDANTGTLGEQLDRLDEPEALRSRFLALAQPEPRSLAGRRTYARPGALAPSLGDRFLGRSEELWRIHHALTNRREASAAHTVVVEGGGGVGKTRLAAEYLYRFGPEEYPGGLFWVNADVPAEDLGEQLHGILSTLVPGLPDWATFRNKEQRDVSEELRKALQALPPDQHILYVVDNVLEPAPGEDPLPLETWCPAPAEVSLLVTTRLRLVFDAQSIALDVPSPADARALLTDGYSDPDVLTAAEWDQLTSWVGRLPLALVLLNAVLAQGSYEPFELLEAARGSTPYRELEDVAEAVRATRLLPGIKEAFLLSYERLPEDARHAARLLAQLAPAAIPLRVLELLGPKVSSHLTRHALLGRSFVTRVRDERKIAWFGQMHPVLADFLRAQAPDGEGEGELAVVGEALAAAMDPESCRDPRAWPLLTACRPHAEHVYLRAKAAAAAPAVAVAAYDLGVRTASLLRAQGRLTAAAPVAEDVARLARRLWGRDDRRTLGAQSILAETVRVQGRLDEAQRLEEKLVEASERALPPDDPDTLCYQAQLAGTLAAGGARAEAAARLRRVVDAAERGLGPDHLDTLAYKQQLAAVLAAEGELEEARRLQEEVVEEAAFTLGVDHHLMMRATANLAEILAALGRLQEARDVQERVVNAEPPLLPPDHPDTMLYRASLATIVAALGDLDEARRLQEDVVEALRQSSEAKDTHTLRITARVTADLGLTMWQQGHLDGARSQLQAALAASREAGRRTGETAQVAWNLFVVLRKLGQHDEAERVKQEDLDWLLTGGQERLDAGQEDVRALLLQLPPPVSVPALAVAV